jgi:putative membrane protein
MTKFFLRCVINAIALYLAIFLLAGRGVDFNGNWLAIIWLALIFGLVNAFLRPLLKVLTCPLIVLTLGLFTLLINTLLFWLTGQIGQMFGLGLSVNGFWPAFFGGIIVSIVSIILSLVFKDELKGKHSKS